MDRSTRFDRAKIEEAFRIVGRYLLERNAFGEIAFYGASAILFQLDWRQTFEAVDARILCDNGHGIVSLAAEHAAKQLDLPRSWLDESAAMCALRQKEEGGRIFSGVYPSADRIGLRVVAATSAYIRAMNAEQARSQSG
jgi:hypothetical protein